MLLYALPTSGGTCDITLDHVMLNSWAGTVKVETTLFFDWYYHEKLRNRQKYRHTAVVCAANQHDAEVTVPDC